MKKKHSFLGRILRIVLKVHLYFWALIALLCLLYNFINPPVTPLILHRYLVRGYDYHKREFIPIEKIPAHVPKYVMALEDPNFYRHFGFEWKMIREAHKRNQKAGAIRFGASTISNQLARTVFLTTHRNYLRKYLEAQITIIMEIMLSKRRMMELYLNYVEWGKGIYGIESASRFYYGKSAAKLKREQAMRLVCILTNPIKYSPVNYSASASARQRYNILQRYF